VTHWIARIGIGIAALIVLTLAVGSTYEFIGRYQSARRFPPPGKLVDIGGRRIQLDCQGAGSPTVVFESGLDIAGSLSWSNVQGPVAKITRACSYSRAGIMWSDRRDGAPSAKLIAQDLHAALSKSGEHGPYVLVGHSMGGPYIVIFTKYYGSDVAGMVFVDASHPEQERRLEAVEPTSGSTDFPERLFKVGAALSWTGVLRFIAPQVLKDDETPHQLARDVDAIAAYLSTSLDPEIKEEAAADETLVEAGTCRQLEDRPLFVLTAMAPEPEVVLAQAKVTQQQAIQIQNVWKQLQDEEATWSSHSRHQLVNDSRHYIQFYRPDIVVNAVVSIVNDVRAAQPPGLDGGH
jgi:pimeloyl-ACP methyl ester carboxylesterase